MVHAAKGLSLPCLFFVVVSCGCYPVTKCFIPTPTPTPTPTPLVPTRQHTPIRHHQAWNNPLRVQKDDINNEITKDASTPTTRSNVMQLSSLLLLVGAAAVATVVLPALAFDSPVDYLHLKIPNPLPDADPRYFLSGGLCAAASHGATTPIDVVKTRIQADPQTYNEGVMAAATKILQDDGPSALLAGLGPTVVGYGLEGAVKFGLYESLKPEMARLLNTGTNESPAIPYLIASVVAGAVASLMLCPMEKTRIRLVTDPTFSSNNLLTGIPQIVRESGVGSLFSGLPAMLSKQVPYTFAKQVSFDTFAAMLYGFAASASLVKADIKIEVSFGAAFLASVLACLLSQPGDVLLTATYKNTGGGDDDGQQPTSFGEVVARISQEQGLQGFFSGISARFVHVGAIITSQLVLYDIVKQMLGLPATGT
jgi:solute carrier family 25 phosphate transporter 3